MKVQLNTVTNFGGQSLKSNDIIDLPLNIAMRWISKGIAHPVKEEIAQGGIVPQNVMPVITLYNDQVLNKTQIEKLKEFKEKVIEVDVIEPIPEQFTSFDEPKEVNKVVKIKPKGKSKK